jgi:hypothetical protein
MGPFRGSEPEATWGDHDAAAPALVDDPVEANARPAL